jgi:serine protease Do
VTTHGDLGFSASGLIAVIAGLTGAALLVVAAVSVVGELGGTTEDSRALSSTSSTTGPAVTTTSPAVAFDPGRFGVVSDDSGTLSIEVPIEWGDMSGSGWVVDGRQIGPTVTAAPDIDAWYSSWDAPGVFVGVSTTDFLPQTGDFSGICTTGKVDERSVGTLSGTVQTWSQCGGESNDFYVFAGGPADASYGVLVQLVSLDGTGFETLQRVLVTFSYHP